MKFKPKFVGLELNLAAYQRHLDEYMTDWLKQAGTLWLQATVISIIPTWSRASRATFEKLARELGTSIPYGPLKSRKDRTDLGRRTGSESGLVLEPSRHRWHFKYHSTLRYLAYNEYNHAVPGEGGVFHGLIHPTPYNFQEAGRREFEDFARFTQLPDPFQKRFLRRVKVR